ncbi:MAG TPA: acyltransferase family protein [Azospirillum sp.]|nr:acyltransferase family protein [Azospirillum sp.]
MRYRAEIDGLRAVAVVPVILFHAGLTPFAGGFVGVDVFFVISGYLITAIIAADIQAGTFSVAGFYERRIRRLLPALAAMLAVSTALAALLFLPHDFREFSDSLIASVFSVSNIFFWRQAGYFNEQAILKPLLHTWSLSVEEQFYIVLPLVLLAVYKLRRGGWVPVLALLATLSFALSVVGVAKRPDAAFYLAPTRAWELLLGSLLAVGAVPAIRGRLLNEAAALLGLGLIGWSVFTFTETTPFPGANALFPCVGTALLIHASPHTTVGRLLALRPMVFVGAISYSLYLWHWPLLVFASYYRFEGLSAPDTAAVLGATVVAATLSWRFVERPFRSGDSILRGRRAFAHAAVAAVLFTTAGAYGHASGGWASRFSPRVAEVDAFAANRHEDPQRCQDRSPADVAQDRLCTIGAPDAPATWLVWGDSHAWSMNAQFDEALRDLGQKAIVASYNGCVPLFGVRRVAYQGPCLEFSESVRALVARHGIRNAVLVAYWTGYYHDTLQADPAAPQGRAEDTAAVLNRGLARTLDELAAAGVRIHLADPLPGARHSTPRAMAASLAWQRPIDNAFTLDEYMARNRDFFATLEAHGKDVRARLSLWKVICGDGRCAYDRDGAPLYFDDNHPTRDNFGFARDHVKSFLRGDRSFAENR